MMVEIDVERLRKDLINYFGPAVSYNPNAMGDIINIENATPQELVRIVDKTSLDINDYIIEEYERRM